MPNILNINLVWWRTWTNQLIKTIWAWLWKWYKTHNLVWYCFWNDDKTTSLYKTSNSKLYWNFRYKLAVWLNFLFDWMTPWHIDIEYLHNYKPYQEADIIHLHSIQWWFINWKYLPIISREKKVVMTCHDDWLISWNDKNNNLFPYKTKRQYNIRKKIFNNSYITYVWVSNWMADKIKQDWIAWNNNVITVYNWINTKVFNKKNKENCRKELWLPLDKKIIIIIAWAWQKSNLKWIAYVNKLKNELKDKKDLLFISVWNADNRIISENQIEVWFINSKTMSKYLSASDIFLYPTLADSFWLVVAESIACWCPIVTFETWWVPEIVHHKKNWYVAKYKDYEDLKKWFERAFDNIAKLNVELDKCFYVENMINEYRELYDSLLKK